jgi:hypothetical protein
MDTLHLIIQKMFVLGIALCFMFVAVYVPQNFNKVNEAEAAIATTAGQIMQNATNLLQLAKDSITSAATVAIEWFEGSMWIKEWSLDRAGWWAAKFILSQVTRDIVRWINSGFQGSPMFAQDLEGYALRLADQAAGVFIANLGSPLLAQFVCAPFRLNIQIAVAAGYRYSRSGFPMGASRCSLSQGLQNIDRFANGSFINGGWNAWYQVAAQPLTYTPYGSMLAAQNELSLRASVSIRNENQMLNFGQGFLSSKICEKVANPGMTKEKCLVSTPGQVIGSTLSHHLNIGSDTLVAADELGEIVGALLGQLANVAITGANGLLGMSGGTGYTSPYDNVDRMLEEQSTIGDNLSSDIMNRVNESIAREEKYINLINSTIPVLESLKTTKSLQELEYAKGVKLEAETNLNTLNKLKSDFTSRLINMDVFSSEYGKLKLHTETQINADLDRWSNLFVAMFNDSKNVVDRALDSIEEYIPRLIKRGSEDALKEIDLINTVYKPALLADKVELEKIEKDWANKSIPRIDVVNHYLDLRSGVIAGPIPLITTLDLETKLTAWNDIIN